MGIFNWLFGSKKKDVYSGEVRFSEIDKYNKSLKEAADSRDLNSFISIYVKGREDRIDVVDEASRLIVQMGKTAVEEAARMLNDKNISIESRGIIAHLLMEVISSQPEIGNSDIVMEELLRTLSDKDFFVSANAAEMLIALGMREIDGVSTREYAGTLRLQKLEDEMKRLQG